MKMSKKKIITTMMMYIHELHEWNEEELDDMHLCVSCALCVCKCEVNG